MATKKTEPVVDKPARQKLNFEQLHDVLVQNVKKTRTKTFTQYTKDLIKTYIQNPYSNINTIREVSRFLARSSMIYKKILEYFPSMLMFSYNVVNRVDFTKSVDSSKMLKSYHDLLLKLQEINMRKEFSTVIATALRDGVYYGYVYDGEGDGFFLQSLDPEYCKIKEINQYGEYIVAMNAGYFDQGNNKEFVQGIDGDTEGIWDDVFVDGYNQYKSGGQDYKWFELPSEKTLCIIAGDDPEMPLPYFLPVFTSLLDLLDLESILASKTELENYILLLQKIPLISGTEEVDDFAVSIPLVEMMDEMISAAVPDLVGTVYSPCDIETVKFDRSNSSDDTDQLSETMHNLFSNLGISELVVSSGSSTNSVGLKHSIQNDESFAFKFLARLESWMNAYIKQNYTEDYMFKFHYTSIYTIDDYVSRQKEAASLGLPVKTYYATSLGMTPYEMMSATYFENALGITDLWEPLESTYTQSSSDEGGAPTKDEDELTPEGAATRDGEKNEGTAAND